MRTGLKLKLEDIFPPRQETIATVNGYHIELNAQDPSLPKDLVFIPETKDIYISSSKKISPALMFRITLAQDDATYIDKFDKNFVNIQPIINFFKEKDPEFGAVLEKFKDDILREWNTLR